MNDVSIEPVEKKVAIKKETISQELIKDMGGKVGELWKIMTEHTIALNEMRKQLDQVRQRMGL